MTERGVKPMADKDSVTKEYMQDSAVFADVFNFHLYGGRQVIKPEQLRPLDTAAVVLPYRDDALPTPVQKYRDVFKMVTTMTDDNAAYMLLGIENQSQIHYAMPVRNMLYDAIEYVAQVDTAAKRHRQNDEKSPSGAEYLSGFWRSDKLLPVITLTVYFGAEEWTAPRDLHSMLAVKEELLPFVPNYPLHLIAPADIADEDFTKFHTELHLALKYMKYARDKKRLNEIVHEDDGYRRVSKRTADMVNIVTGSKLKYEEREEKIDMCLAIEEMRRDAMTERKEKGMEEGMEKGRREGMEEGMEKGRREGVFTTLAGLVKDGILTLTQAADRANMTAAEFERRMS